MSISLVLQISIVVFLATFIRTVFGFGEAVVGMPLLTLLPLYLHTAVSLMGLISLTVAVLTVIAGGWRHIDRGALFWLATATVFGIPCGIALLAFAPTGIITFLLGSVLLTYALYSLTRDVWTNLDSRPRCRSKSATFIFGFISGMLGSAYNFNGVPIAVYGTLRKWRSSCFRSTIQAHFLISGAFIVTGQYLGGLWTANLSALYWYSLPALGVGVALGIAAHRKVPAARFQKYVFLLIGVLGIVLVVK